MSVFPPTVSLSSSAAMIRPSADAASGWKWPVGETPIQLPSGEKKGLRPPCSVPTIGVDSSRSKGRRFRRLFAP